LTELLQNAIKALQWLCFSDRPLQLVEMVEILAIENGDQGGFFPEERLPDPTDIMTVCSSLITLNLIDDGEDNDDSGNSVNIDRRIQIQLAHFSVKEFLLSDQCAFEKNFRSQICHFTIAENCLHYLLHLCQNGPVTEEVIKQYPLALYAAEHWWQRTQTISGVLDDTFLDLISRLLTNEDASLLSWAQLYNIDTPWRDFKFNLSLKPKDMAQPLCYAAHIGVPAIVEK